MIRSFQSIQATDRPNRIRGQDRRITGDAVMGPGSIRFSCVARGDMNFICVPGFRPGSSEI